MSTVQQPLLEVKNLHAGYGAAKVVQGVDLTVYEGEAVAVLGANGAGKTTLLRSISGLIQPTAGEVTFAATDIVGVKTSTICRHGLIHVPEGRKLFPRMTVMENLRLGALPGKPAQRASETMAEVLERFPILAERANQLAGTLSGGEQQQLAFGRGLMSLPRLLVLDEPTLGLSPLLAEAIFGSVKELHTDGLSIVVVSQDVIGSLEVVDRAYVLENGRCALDGTAEDLSDDDAIREAYLGL